MILSLRRHPMQLHRVVCSLVLVFVLCINGFAEDSLNVQQAIALTLRQNQALLANEALVRAAQARVHQTESADYPMVGISGDLTGIGPIPAFSFPGYGSIALAPASNLDLHVGAAYTIYDFGKRNAREDVAKSSVSGPEDASKSMRSALTQQTIQAFFGVIFLRRSVAVQQEQIDAFVEHLQDTRRKVESGSATEFDSLSTSVRVAQARNQKIDLERALDDQEVSLRRLIGLAWDGPLTLTGTFTSGDADESVETLLLQAKEHRPDLVTARDIVATAKLGSTGAHHGDDPSLLVHASYGLRNGFEPNLDVARGNWSVGASVEVPVFDGFLTRSRIEEADAMVLASERHLADVDRTAEAEVRQAFAAVRSARAKINATDLQVVQAIKAVENARIRYQSGAGTNLDILDAETSASTSRLQQLQALYQLVLAQTSLQAAVGLFAR